MTKWSFIIVGAVLIIFIVLSVYNFREADKQNRQMRARQRNDLQK